MRLPEIRQVLTFQSAGEALAAFRASPPDLIITDFNMPGMNGLEFLEALRQRPDLEEVPVIVVSSHAETEKRHRALQAGATDFLMVPFDTFEFQARTRNLLRLSLHQKALKSQSLSLRSELLETRHLSMQTRHRFTSIIDSVPALVFAVNAARECVFANQYCFDFLGISGDQGLWGTQLLASKVAAGDTNAFAEGQLAAREITLTGLDQREHIFLVLPRPVNGGGPEQDLIVYSGIEISQLKETERSLRYAKDEAEVANRAKSAFLSNMTHEIRTPLNAIIGFTDMICNELHGPVGNEKYKGYLQDVQSSASHLLAVINEILDFSQIEANRHEPTLSRFSLRECLAEIGHLTMLQVSSHRNGLNIEAIPDLTIHSDRQKLTQVLLNIITNASNSMREGLISITAAQGSDGGLIITIDDNGPGMDANELALAVTEFGRVSSSAFISRDQGGTGLGLPISIGFMKLLGGDLDIQSQKGVGTTVRVCLPEVAVAVAVAEPRPDHSVAAARQAGPGGADIPCE